MVERKEILRIEQRCRGHYFCSEDVPNETDWDELFEDAHSALERLGEIHNTTTTTLQESENVFVVQTDEDIDLSDENEIEALTKIAEMMLQNATLVPVQNPDKNDTNQ